METTWAAYMVGEVPGGKLARYREDMPLALFSRKNIENKGNITGLRYREIMKFPGPPSFQSLDMTFETGEASRETDGATSMVIGG